MPMRWLAITAGGCFQGDRFAPGIAKKSAPFHFAVIPIAWVNFPGPEQRSVTFWTARRSNIDLIPARGSRARINTNPRKDSPFQKIEEPMDSVI
jgi:hypothetical protein